MNAPISTFSRTVISPNRLWACGTSTTPLASTWRGASPTSESPRKEIWPRRARRMPVIVASSVDLPEPLGPTMHMISCCATVNETPLRMSPPP